MTKIKPCMAFAVVKKSKMKISAYDIFKDKPEIGKDELLIKVSIKYEPNIRKTKSKTALQKKTPVRK